MLNLLRRRPAPPVKMPRPPTYDKRRVEDMHLLADAAARADRIAVLLREALADASRVPGTRSRLTRRAALALARAVPDLP